MNRDETMVKAALEAAFRVCPTMSTAQANILALTNSHERLAAIAAGVPHKIDVLDR